LARRQVAARACFCPLGGISLRHVRDGFERAFGRTPQAIESMEVHVMGFSMQHLLLFAVIALLLFGGRGKISEIMGDFAKGIKSFKKGLADDDVAANAPKTGAIENRSSQPVDASADQRKVG
jgi:sec-independent protein translocase protein TatA